MLMSLWSSLKITRNRSVHEECEQLVFAKHHMTSSWLQLQAEPKKEPEKGKAWGKSASLYVCR